VEDVTDALERLGHQVIGCAVAVHKALGPGFTEAVYRRALELELHSAAVPFSSELSITVAYRGTPIGPTGSTCSSTLVLFSN